jgi:hypothetical protein
MGGTRKVEAAGAVTSPVSVAVASPAVVSPLGSPSGTTKKATRANKGASTTGVNPSTAALDSDPVKRARRTAIERRSRQQRQARVKLLQDEVATLSNILDNLTLPKKLQDNARSLLKNAGLVPPHTPPPKVLLAKMDSLAKEMRALEREHRQMQRRLYEHQNASAVIRDLVLQPAPDDWDMNIKRWDAISRQYFTPLTREECDRIIDDCMKTITRFSLSDDFVSSGYTLNGWVDRTRHEPSTSTLEFSFSKHVPFVDPAKQFTTYWNIFWNENEYRRVMLGLSAKYHMHVLQRISDDIVILRQDIKYPRIDVTCHHICIQFRQRTALGQVMCMRTIPVPQVQLAMPDVIWTQNFLWYVGCVSLTVRRMAWNGGLTDRHLIRCRNHFDEVRDREGEVIGGSITACGSITSESAEYAKLWILETAVTVLRVESALVAPLLCS